MTTRLTLKRLACAVLLCAIPYEVAAAPLVISAVGDIMLAGTARPHLERNGYDFPFSATRSILTGSHIAMGNLEAPISTAGTEFRAKKFRFRASPKTAPALQKAGFSLLTLANNHILDYSQSGLNDTIAHLTAHGIRYTGAGTDLASARTPAIITTLGKRVAFLAYSLTYPAEFFASGSRGGTAPGYAAMVTADIAAARTAADYVIVSFHWGRELADTPQPYQVSAARQAIDAGADVVIGHHPHVLQGIESYRRGIIFYSLGNFAFGSNSRNANRAIIARITLDEGVKEVEIIPLNVLNREVGYQPQPLGGKKGDQVVERLNRLSAGKGVRITAQSGRYLVTTGGS